MKKLSKLLSFVVVCALMIGCISVFAACTPESHTHTFETTWTSDETNHWHKATCEHTTEVSGKAAHTFDPDTNKCTVCGYEKKVEEHVHAFDETKWVNTDPDQHWHPATCGHDTEKGSPAAHTFVGNTCSVCGYTKTVEKTAKCDVYCPVCGKCADIFYCTEDTDHCGDAMAHKYRFEAEEATLIEGSGWPNVNKGINEDPNIEFVQGMSDNPGGGLTFTFTASKAFVGSIHIRCAGNNDREFLDSITTLINGDMIGVDIEGPAGVKKPGDGKEKFSKEITIGCYQFKEGVNTIEMIIVADGKGANMDYIELCTDSDVEIEFQYVDNRDHLSEGDVDYPDGYVTPSERKKDQ